LSASGIGPGGRTSVLKVDGKVVAGEKMNLMDRTFILVLQWDETFDVGTGTGKARTISDCISNRASCCDLV